MHWHAIRLSTAEQAERPINLAHESTDLVSSIRRLHLDGNDSRKEGEPSVSDDAAPRWTGDDACDIKPELEKVTGLKIPEPATAVEKAVGSSRAITSISSSEIRQAPPNTTYPEDAARRSQASSPSASHVSRLTEESLRSLNSSFSPSRTIDECSKAMAEDAHTSSTRTFVPFIQVGMQTHAANNLAPFAYQRALRNRIRDDELSPGRKYDTKAYTPMFVHDCLMVPGSLANIRGKGSAEDVVRRMTPALLPGFHAHAHATTHEPLLLQSPKPGDHVTGMLVFGQSKKVRRNVHEHYRPFCKRIKVEVELDTVHPVSAHLRRHSNDRWELRRRSVWAHAWIWRNAHSGDARLRSQWDEDEWRFDDYLASKHEPAQGLRIEPAGWIEDDRETAATDDVEQHGAAESSPEHRTTVANEITTHWEEVSGAPAAIPFDDYAWDHYEASGESGEKDDYDVDRGALDRDYDRSGSAGCW